MILFYFLVKAVLSAVAGPSLPEQRDSQLRPLNPAPDSTGTFTFRHRWSEGAWAGAGKRLRRLAVRTDLAYERLGLMADRFGIPEAWVEERPFTTNRERAAFRTRLAREAARRGVRVRTDGEEMWIEPSYRWILDNSREDTADLARRLHHILESRNLTRQRDLHRVVASLVQSIEYAIPEPRRVSREGKTILTLGVATPIEVLHNRWGDCDSKSLLFAAILENFPDEKVIFLMGNDHLFVGVRGIPRRGDHHVTIQGVKYVLIEMTSPWPVGQIPRELWSGVVRNRFLIDTL